KRRRPARGVAARQGRARYRRDLPRGPVVWSSLGTSPGIFGNLVAFRAVFATWPFAHLVLRDHAVGVLVHALEVLQCSGLRFSLGDVAIAVGVQLLEHAAVFT